MAYYRTTFSGQIFRFVCGSEQLLHCSHAPRHRAPPDATEWRYGTLRQALKRNTDCHWTGRYFDKKPVKNFLQELELNSYFLFTAFVIVRNYYINMLARKRLAENMIKRFEKIKSIRESYGKK
jgi:hypothetical protein